MIERPPPLEFPYGVLEKALAKAYGVSEKRRPVGFRGMISNLHKMGVLGPQSRVGRGAKLTYTPGEFTRLILALELSEFGLTPATVVALVGRYWESNLKAIMGAANAPFGILPEKPRGEDVILCLVGVGLRIDSLRGETAPAVPIIEQRSLDDLPAAVKQWMESTADDQTPPRVLVANLSHRLRIFHDALADENLADALAERRAALAGDEPPPKARTAPELK
jgi:hypothetical protein